MKKLLFSLSTLLFLQGTAGNPKTNPVSEKNQLSSPNVVGEALNFDGVTDMVVSSPHSVLTEYTVEAWIKLNNLNNQNIITATDNMGPLTSASHQIKLVNGKFVHYLYDGLARTLTSTITVATGTWYHVAISAKNNGTMKIIVNNNETVSSFNIGTIWQSLNKFHLGGNAIGVGYFNGELDEVRIWNRQLCFDEITNNMNGEIATSATGLITNYHFNQGVAGSTNTGLATLTDASGFNKNGTLLSFALQGSTSNWVAPGAVTAGNTITPYTVSNITVTPPAQACSGIQYSVTASGANSYNWSNGGTGSSLIFTHNVSNPTAFSFTVVGYDSNGCPSTPAIANYSVYPTPTITISNSYTCSGSSFTINPSGATNYTYSTGSSVISPTSNTTYTVIGASQYGCINSTTATVFVQNCGQSGSSLSFDGINDVVNTPIDFDATTYQNWTYECWVKSPVAPVNNNGYDGPMYGSNMGIIWNHAQGSFMGSATVQSANNNYYAATFGGLSANTWYHLAATYDGSVLKAYKNGVLTGTVLTNGGLATVTGSLMIGRHPAQAHFWEGTIDEARIWTTARTCSEINQFMNTELAGNETGLKAYYNFNEGTPMGTNTSITSLSDQTSNGLNASISNFSLTGNSSNFFLGAPFNATVNNCGVTTGLKELTNNLNIAIYPNPTNSILNIEVSQPATIAIVNVLGDVVLTETINEFGKLDVSNLTSGIYFIKETKSGKAIKFIKE